MAASVQQQLLFIFRIQNQNGGSWASLCGVCMFSPGLHGFSRGSAASSHVHVHAKCVCQVNWWFWIAQWVWLFVYMRTWNTCPGCTSAFYILRIRSFVYNVVPREFCDWKVLNLANKICLLTSPPWNNGWFIHMASMPNLSRKILVTWLFCFRK